MSSASVSTDWLVPAASAVPLATALALLCLRRASARLAAPIGAAACLLTLGIALWATVLVAQRASTGPGAAAGRVPLQVDLRWVPALGLRAHVGLDGVSAPLVLLTALLGLLVCGHLILVPPETRVPPVDGAPAENRVPPANGTLASGRRLVALVLAVTGGAIATFTALDAFLFFICFEIVLIPMWFVIALWGDDAQPEDVQPPSSPRPGGERGRRDAANRFILYTATGSAVMLLGIILVALRTGTTDLVVLAGQAGGGISPGVQLGAAVLIVAGLAVKTPAWPLHTWLPPAHTIAPTAGSVLLAGVLLKLGTYGMIRLAVPVVPAGMRTLAPYLGALAVAGIIWAGLACLLERDLKRLVAFSSVAHMGFVLLGIASMSAIGLQGALYGNVAHGVVTALLFFVVGALKDREHSADLAVLGSGLRDRMPRLGWLLTVGAVAGLGLPGLAVFWGELLAIAGAWHSSALGALARPLAVLAAIGTAIAAAYWLRVLRLLWMGTAAPLADAVPAGSQRMGLGDATRQESLTAAPLAIAVLALGLVPGPLLALTAPVVRGLLSGGGIAP